ncbi:hypothetical protein [Streptomyces cucumeris]|uniref:hypothetical protein n=1 Tax=Streptomyces cucumeris TaxID=2962890 RepID=UPI0020C8D294|nr:hypothetical protein [Streptomyces sp. NEAU-Y11]MCP9209731.1 hypothetical protein [Streptomyces sp. NEAU-Y11]
MNLSTSVIAPRLNPVEARLLQRAASTLLNNPLVCPSGRTEREALQGALAKLAETVKALEEN